MSSRTKIRAVLISDELGGGWKLMALLFLLSIAAYGPALSAYFVDDDFEYVQLYKNWTHFNWGLLTSDWTQGVWGVTFPEIRPVAAVLFALNATLFGIQPTTYHLTNVVLHSLTGWLIFWIASRVGAERGLA